jgi:iron complex transport system substrate-binding protein
MQTILVEEAGGIAVWKETWSGQAWSRVSFEQIAAWDADHIFITSYFTDVDEVKALLTHEPLWESLRAVQKGNIHAFPSDYYSWDLPDPRWILGLMWIATRLFPGDFNHVDLHDEVRNFFEEMYFMDDDAYNRYIVPNLQGDLSRDGPSRGDLSGDGPSGGGPSRGDFR